ncbi:alpha-L-rhamnosidase-related protein [Cohnella cholangitidis]|uniref:Bacterial alpha-L-rhamnosidase n=1 Tax=Cohnella cholangitidis TaxID=2598458 RepID=A0A7G5BW97_9BACL|nr:alpha-L-rhamnosidase C-terminal domain-containing protein [Cohnella cholangitidis]QMV41231.1 Bacterial alpha-L-rhamnosidase [Cohnella cholangitidis]
MIIGDKKDSRTRAYITPKRIVWQSSEESATVEGAEVLLREHNGQATLTASEACLLRNEEEASAGLLLDFGKECHGGIEITVWTAEEMRKTSRIRVRFGESVMEAMSEIEGGSATNDHAVRDLIVPISSFMGTTEIGQTGFRFVRIDLLDRNSYIQIKSIRAVALYRDLEYKGSFRSSDPLLDEIWMTGAYTVHLNMQNYLWDGIKRDRLVWVGDLHPEISTIHAVFGRNEVVSDSLDLIRDETPLPRWMNNFPSYSMWWILIQHDWYLQHGDKRYLAEQRTYLTGLLSQLIEQIAEDGSFQAPEPFLDWPTRSNERAVQAGVHALALLAIAAGKALCEHLQEHATAERCQGAIEKLRKPIPGHGNSKQAAALMALSGLADPATVNDEVLSVDGAHRISTFLGYYVLKAKGEAGDITGSLDVIRQYWGGMLALGATTFWEDFDIRWLENAARIDELTPPGKVDVHGTYGDYCYVGFRHSLCHGWASGPTAWLSEYVLGVQTIEPGCATVRIKPRLGDLDWVEGTYPTPHGEIRVRHEKQRDGSVISQIEAPEPIRVITE